MVTCYLIFRVALICNLACWCHADNSPIQVDQREEFCEEVGKTEEITAFLGFPFELEYPHGIVIKLYLKGQDLPEEANVTCTVTETISNRIIETSVFPKVESPYNTAMYHYVSYKTPEVTMDMPQHFKTECRYSGNSSNTNDDPNEPVCYFRFANITILDQLSDHCNGTVVETTNRQMEKDSMRRLLCTVPESFKKSPNMSIHWFREKANGDCEDKFHDNFVFDDSNNLILKSPDFEDAGVYTCMAYFNDKKMIVKRQKVCVKHRRISYIDSRLQCNAEMVPLHGNGTITCKVKVSISRDYMGHYSWSKISNGEVTSTCNDTDPTDDKRISCHQETSLKEDPCYFSKPPGTPPADERTLTLNINNMKSEDFGEYRVTYYPLGREPRTTANVTIELDPRHQGTVNVARIAIGVFITFLFIGLIMLGLAMKMDILWFYKKHFGPCERGVYPYMAYFMYNYQVGKENAERMKKIKTLITRMHKFMDKFGGTVFDEHRDVPLAQCDGDNILTVQKDCHRIILFLSPDFITDHWSRFATYTAIETVIQEGKKIILITMSDTKDAMKQIEKEPRRVLEMAMKRNVTIYWNGKVPLNGEFRRRLEYALPKYGKPDLSRFLSDSSQAHLTQHVGSPAKSLMEMKTADYKTGFGNSSAV